MSWRAKLDSGRVVGEYPTRPAAVAALLAAGATARDRWLFGGSVERIEQPVAPYAQTPAEEAAEAEFWNRPLRSVDPARLEAQIANADDYAADYAHGPGAAYRTERRS